MNVHPRLVELLRAGMPPLVILVLVLGALGAPV
ncbi:hypothetical protein NAEX_02436 [Nannocystis exedens]|nr:hypothetical protein NAEX_02436 [Nannocystis exedens]